MQKFAPALIACAVLASAGSASAQDYRIPFGDLVLSQPTDAQALDQRIGRTARDACRDHYRGAQILSCVRVFRAEAMRNLPAPARQEYARARNVQRVVT